MAIDRRFLTHVDFVIPLLLIPIILMSYFLIAQVSPAQNLKQTIYIIIGIVAFLICFLIPFRRLNMSIVAFYWICIILLVLVDIVGTKQLGAQRWLTIGAFSIQPSEPIKIAIILILGRYAMQNPPPADGYNLKQFLILSGYILLPCILILKQPDLGTTLVILFMGFGILFLIGVNKKIWITLILCLAVISPILYGSLKDYQKKRIHDFISEKPSYHVEQSIIAIGSGRIFGKPKNEALQTNLKFLPIATSDFIFAYYVERFGFLGAIVLLVLYLGIIIQSLTLSLLNKQDYFLIVVACSVSLLIFFYVAVNIAMTINLAPVVGVPLPFFSYGGSSFITFMILIGILENLLAFRFNFSYNPNPFKAFSRQKRR